MGNFLVKSLQYLLAVYTAAAVIFTSWVYVLTPAFHLLRPESRPSQSTPRAEITRVSSNIKQSLSLLQDHGRPLPALEVSVPLDDNFWANAWPYGYASSEIVQIPRSRVTSGKITRVEGYDIRQETLLSKAFSDAIHPTRIIPFYFKASSTVEPDDVTITTLVTSNRFRVFRQLVEHYRGPISVTIHIPLPLHASFASLQPDHPSRVALSNLHALYASSPLFSEHVDVHLALSPFMSALSPEAVVSIEGEGGRQFNVWRNAARLFARTDFVMMLDVDFAVCTDWRGFVRDAVRAASSSPIRHVVRTGRRSQTSVPDSYGVNGTEIVKLLREGSAALVVPAFEYVKQEDGVDQRAFPADKEVSQSFLLRLRSLPCRRRLLPRTLSHILIAAISRRPLSSWRKPIHPSSRPSMHPGHLVTTAPITRSTTQSHPAQAPSTRLTSTRVRTSRTSSLASASAGTSPLSSISLPAQLRLVLGRRQV